MTSRSGRKSRVSAIEVLLIVLSLAAIGAAAWMYLRPDPVSRNVDVMERRIKDLRELRTVSQMYRSVIYFEDRNFWLGTRQVLFTLEYDVVAGVDFSGGIEITPLPEGALQVRMPPARILSADADESTIRELLLREQPVFNPVRMGDYIPQVLAQGEEIVGSAIRGGILDRAEAGARVAVTRILHLAGVQSVIFGAPLTVDSGGPEEAADSQGRSDG